jgi:hypothetical protein
MSRFKLLLAAAFLVLFFVLSVLGLGSWLHSPAALAATDQKKTSEVTYYQGDSPVGTWKRVVKSTITTTFHIEPDHLCCTIVRMEDHRKFTVDFRADYHISKDGILYGLITSATAPGARDNQSLEEMLKVERAFIDAPFSLRFRVDGNTLTVKDFRIGVLGGKMTEEELPLYLGRYVRQTAAKPAP